MKIVLIGYMASGKSTIGKEIKKHLQEDIILIDLDHYIEAKEMLTIPEIFQQYGEEGFRRLEAQYLYKLLSSTSNLIISTGGGAPCYYDNMQAILQYGISFFLNIPIPIIIDRILNSKQVRPLASQLQTAVGKAEFIKRYQARLPFYEQANYMISSTKKKDALEEILAILQPDNK